MTKNLKDPYSGPYELTTWWGNEGDGGERSLHQVCNFSDNGKVCTMRRWVREDGKLGLTSICMLPSKPGKGEYSTIFTKKS